MMTNFFGKEINTKVISTLDREIAKFEALGKSEGGSVGALISVVTGCMQVSAQILRGLVFVNHDLEALEKRIQRLEYPSTDGLKQ